MARMNRRQTDALVRLFTSKSPAAKIAALVLLIPLIVAIWQGCSHRSMDAQAPKAEAGYIVGDVVGVSDGDTIRVLDRDKRQHKVRFAFIDAPEKAQPYGQAAKQALSDKIYRKVVKVEIIDTDQYGRTVGRVWLDDQDINYAQLNQGWAWHYRLFAKKNQRPDDFKRYQAAEEDAQSGKIGLWQEPNPTAPWDWRRSKRKSDAARSNSSGGDAGGDTP